ncbi:hypothetical protein ABZ914_01840, partial [Spirillospora sp. NPDC046719]
PDPPVTDAPAADAAPGSSFADDLAAFTAGTRLPDAPAEADAPADAPTPGDESAPGDTAPAEAADAPDEAPKAAHDLEEGRQ